MRNASPWHGRHKLRFMTRECNIAPAAMLAGSDRIRLTEAALSSGAKDHQASMAVTAHVAHARDAFTISFEPASGTRISGGESRDVTTESLSVTFNG